MMRGSLPGWKMLRHRGIADSGKWVYVEAFERMFEQRRGHAVPDPNRYQTSGTVTIL